MTVPSHDSYGRPLLSCRAPINLCGNKACVNADHLEPVTNSENLCRAIAAKRVGGESNALVSR